MTLQPFQRAIYELLQLFIRFIAQYLLRYPYHVDFGYFSLTGSASLPVA